MTKEFPFKEECYRIIGCAMEVHKTLGPGFLEPVYQEALALELSMAGIPYLKEKVLDIRYKEKLLTKKYVADFICFNQLIVEPSHDKIFDTHANDYNLQHAQKISRRFLASYI